MNYHLSTNKILELQPANQITELTKITKLTQHSYLGTDVLQVTFKNEYQLSIIRGKYTYGGVEGLFEIVALAPNNDFYPAIYLPEDSGDDVVGRLTAEEVQKYIKLVGDIS